MKIKKKTLLISLGILVVVIIIGANIFFSKQKMTVVQADLIKRIDIKEQVSASGSIQPKTKVNITAEVNAKILAIYVKEGETVTKGQSLIQLDTVQPQKDVDQYGYSLNEIEARTEGAKTSFLQAEAEYNRQKQLFERNLTSETLLKDAEYAYLNSKCNYDAMLSQAKQGQSMYEKAVDNLGKTKITAPMDGVLTYLDAEVGEIAQAQTSYTQGKTLMIVSNMNAFEVAVDVDETEITKILLGQSAKIEVDAFPDTTFNGEVVEIGNTAVVSNTGSTEQSTNFKVKILFTEGIAHIRPGMSASVDIITNTRSKTLTVPYGAIVMRSTELDSTLKQDPKSLDAESDSSLAFKKDKDIKGVYLAKNGKAKFAQVTTGIADQKNIEIITGVVESDTVITGPFKTLRALKNDENIKIEKMNEKEKSL
jgi:HlyD family secretion protein